VPVPPEVIAGILKVAADWIAEARRTIRSRKALTGANLLYEAGLVVVALVAIRDRMNELLGPLRNFNPSFWDDQKRRALVEDLRSFALDESAAFSTLLEHSATLARFRSEPKNEVDIHELTRTIIRAADNVTHVGAEINEILFRQRATAQSWTQALKGYQRQGVDEFGEVSIRVRHSDVMMIHFLPALLWLVWKAEEKPEIEALRELASGLMSTRSRSGDEELDTLVKKTQRAFGELRGEITKLYPEIPTLSWADSNTAVS
jgi:hypothetical protein